VDIAAGNLEVPMLDQKEVRVAGEGDDLVALVERQFGGEAPCHRRGRAPSGSR
jgi:hypothetical protein